MSMIRCEECEGPIDSDLDPECFVKQRPGKSAVLCKWCREETECKIPTVPCHRCSRRGIINGIICPECSGDGDIEVHQIIDDGGVVA